MNQKDYKAIAEIITAYLCKYSCKKDEKIKKLRNGILEELADYFEKEDKKWDNPIFNKEQFLKDCGVIK